MRAALTLATAVMLGPLQPQESLLARACCSQNACSWSLLQPKQLWLPSPKRACLVDRRLVLQLSALQGSVPLLQGSMPPLQGSRRLLSSMHMI